jgi:hypothetical protein
MQPSNTRRDCGARKFVIISVQACIRVTRVKKAFDISEVKEKDENEGLIG